MCSDNDSDSGTAQVECSAKAVGDITSHADDCTGQSREGRPAAGRCGYLVMEQPRSAA